MPNNIWKNLYDTAKAVINPKKISAQICSGGVGAALLTKNGHIYTGVNIDTDCSLGMCAERNAVSTMITAGEFEIAKIVAVNKKGQVLPPCGACREFMMQLDKTAGEIEILSDYETKKTIRLKSLTPEWWSKDQMEMNE